MVLLKNNQEVGVWVDLKFARRICSLQHLLSKLFAQILDLQDSEGVLADCNETFRAL